MIKKTTQNLKAFYFLLSSGLVLISGSSAFARQVPQNDAQKVAENFFKQHSSAATVSGELKYTSFDSHGAPLFYAFNINNDKGFVIVAAEDAAQPIIGYSTEQGFVKPDSRSTAAYWLSKRETEITFLRENNVPSNTAINSKWAQYLSAQTSANRSTSTAPVVAPLVLTKWNQSPFYNDSCPGGSVTGCVATTMSQIMKYWSYPDHGTGASSYCDCSSSGFSANYGMLKANYGAATYNWSNMPLMIGGHNPDIAKIMFHAGVSVHMDYTPSESGAQVIGGGASAQHAYTTYFNYDPTTILGSNRSSYPDATWISMLKNDLNIGRPVQYAGFGSAGGHTWVCDGYDQNDFFHMNWGWAGASDGYYNINALNPSGMDFSQGEQAIFGILPIATNAVDAGIVSISPTSNGCSSNQYSPTIKIRNYGTDPLTSCTILYTLDNGTQQSMQWSGSLVTGQAADVSVANYTLTSGAHILSCSVTNPNNGNGMDANYLNDQSSYNFAVYSADNLPIVEGFENAATTNIHWNILPVQAGSDWAFTTQAFSGGAQSLMVNNLNNTPSNTSILQGMNNYDFSNTQDPYIHFKVAYQQKATSNNDKLSLQISNDCGNTWWVKWTKQGSALATTTVLSSSAYVPAAGDFVEYSVPAVMSTSVLFRWVFVSDATAPGNNIYLDDINIFDNAALGIKTNTEINNSFEVYPNPGSGETFLKFRLTTATSVEVTVTDIFGRKIIDMANTQYTAGDQLVSINKDNTLSKGIYMVTINANGAKSTRKLVIN